MIIDSLRCFDRYVEVNPRFAEVARYLAQTDLASLPAGRHAIQGDDIYVNIVDAQPKAPGYARLESHQRMIDIQIPISGPEDQGWAPIEALEDTPFDTEADIRFHDNIPQTYIRLLPGQFVIYFPDDGHAPAITTTTLRKAIFKVKA